MQIGKLDHVNVRTANLDKMVAWYGEMLGMKPGKRPNFSFPGAWLYAGDNSAVHLIGIDHAPPNQDDLQLEHFAFQASGFRSLKARLEAAGERHDVIVLERRKQHGRTRARRLKVVYQNWPDH